MIFAIFGVAMCACCAVCHRQVFVLLLLSIMFVVGTAVLSEMTRDKSLLADGDGNSTGHLRDAVSIRRALAVSLPLCQIDVAVCSDRDW